MTEYTKLRDKITGKAREITKKVTDIKQKILAALGGNFNLKLKTDVDAAIKVILDDSFLKVIDKVVIALANTINRTSQEFEELVQQIYECHWCASC
jgi:BMFP domain-containing protein YqiC